MAHFERNDEMKRTLKHPSRRRRIEPEPPALHPDRQLQL